MARASDITSFTDHRQRLRDHFRQVRETGRPLFVTTNGEAAAVVMSPETYDRLMDKVELLESLIRVERGMEEVREGRVQPARKAMRDLASDLGLELDR